MRMFFVKLAAVIIAAGLVVTGCGDVDFAEKPEELLEFTRTDMLALQHLMKNHETPIEDLQASVEGFLKDSSVSRSVEAIDSAIVISFYLFLLKTRKNKSKDLR
jgi:hypothetical protein